MNWVIRPGCEKECNALIQMYERRCRKCGSASELKDIKLVFVKEFYKLLEEVKPSFKYPDWGYGHDIPTPHYIGPNVEIEEGVKIGDNVTLVGNIYIHSGTFIGNNVVVKAGTVIGGQGFGFVEDEDGTLIPFPHIGSVVIGHNVHIGSQVCIDKGVFGQTLLDDNCKIDNLTHISHDCKIHKGALVMANVTICGHAMIGEKSRVAAQSVVVPRVHVGNNVQIGVNSTVMHDIDSDSVAYGSPAKAVRDK